jgi:drug/metabolite transporter (DMT)-like permease
MRAARAGTRAYHRAPDGSQGAPLSSSGAPAASAAGDSVRRAATLRGMAWMALGGLLLVSMNALMKRMTTEMNPLQAQFLRYVFGLALMLPWILRAGWAAYRPRRLPGQLWRGACHCGALTLFFVALPHVPLADMTAILFITPIFVLAGAALVLRERVTAARWGAAAVGLVGIAIVVWPHLGGGGRAGAWSLVMLASAPLFAASFLINKALTRHDSAPVIVAWQNLTVTLFALPMALPFWVAPTAWQWAAFLACGVLGNAAHLCMTRAFGLADISAMQPVRYLDLVWSAMIGAIFFADLPTGWTLSGAAVVIAANVWIARREAVERAGARPG